jgi:hypothetical protein
VQSRKGLKTVTSIIKDKLWASCMYGSDNGAITTFIIKTTNPEVTKLTECLRTAIEKGDAERVQILLASGAKLESDMNIRLSDDGKTAISEIVDNYKRKAHRLTLKNKCLLYIFRNKYLFRQKDLKQPPKEAFMYN